MTTERKVVFNLPLTVSQRRRKVKLNDLNAEPAKCDARKSKAYPVLTTHSS